jgi:uncharacterized protein
MPNRLATSRSAYLRSAAEQPVDWHPWGAEPFERAQREGRPVLLDIGAVWCHWCHVMDRESYEDPGIAALLSERYVCIKVDRDEQPDVDARYQRAVQGLTGQGGWPLTAFLTAEADVFYGGTYFPPEGKYGRPGFRSVLERVADLYRDSGSQVGDQAARVRAFVREQLDEAGPGDWDAGLLVQATDKILSVADLKHGGFGHRPKFPHPAATILLLHAWQAAPAEALHQVVVRTLNGMADGGFRDQLGGGFHRYSTDERWLVPHFEKMSHDNSELLRAYAVASVALAEPRFGEVARETIRWVREVLADPEGGYGASQDADQGPEDDGDYFTWSIGEVDRILPEDEAKVAIVRFGLGTDGRMPHDPSRNVLFLAESVPAVAERTGLATDVAARRLTGAVDRLREARARRPTPFVDRTRYAAWNAMMAGALIQSGPMVGDDWALRHGLASLGRLRREQTDGSRVRHGDGQAAGLLDDQMQAALAAIDAYEATGEVGWLEWAESLAGWAAGALWDPEGGGFFDRPPDAEATGLLATRARPIQDNPTPSGNGVAGLVLSRLHELTGEPRWREMRDRLLAAFAERARELGLFASTYLQALDWAVRPVTQLVVTGPPGDPAAEVMHWEALRAFVPRRVVARVTPDTPARVGSAGPVGDLARDRSRVAGYVCTGTTCLAPAATPAEWRGRLGAAGAVPGAVAPE